jgi:hypothetical protein
MSLLDTIFDDKRVAITLLMIWLLIVLCAFQSIDLFHADFMHFGPSKNTKLMTMTIDTWNEWTLVAVASFASTCVNDFTGDSIVPWIQNTIQDHKTRYLPYSKAVCYTIVQLWAIYCNIMSIFSVSLLMSQIDFLLIRLVADLIVNTFTTFKFLRTKEVNKRLYDLDGRAAFMNNSSAHTAVNVQSHSMVAANDIMAEVLDNPSDGEDSSYPLKGRGEKTGQI